MSDEWKWRDSGNKPSQPGNNDPSFVDQTITPAWESGTPGSSQGTSGPPPAPLPGSAAAYGRQGPATPQFSPPPYHGPPAFPPPYAPPPSYPPPRQAPPPPYAPVPGARAAPRRDMLRRRYLLLLIPL